MMPGHPGVSTASFMFQAEIQGPQDTPYEGKYFQLKLVLSCDFPSSPPRGFFLTKIYHPNVDMSTGAICVNTLKKDWKSDLGLKHVLLTVKCLLIVPNPESALNEEAGKLLLERYDDYCARARLYTEIHARGEAAPKSGKISPSEEDEGTSSSSSTSAAVASSSSSTSSSSASAPEAKKKALSKKEKSLKDKKKTLKRL